MSACISTTLNRVGDVMSSNKQRSFGTTERQARVLSFIQSYRADKGYSPSYQDIADAVGISSRSGVKRVIDALVERGHLETLPCRARAIVLVGAAS
jgi:repressor LexA